jgi:hypothetical protein
VRRDPGGPQVSSTLTRRLFKGSEFSDRDDLVAEIIPRIANYDRTAEPFALTYDRKPLKVA